MPFSRDIIQLGVQVLRDSLPITQRRLGHPSCNLHQSHFNGLGAFGTGERFRLYFDTLALGSTGKIVSFARRVASEAPSAVLFSTYFETWPSISYAQAGERIAGYFELLGQSLRAALRLPVLQRRRRDGRASNIQFSTDAPK